MGNFGPLELGIILLVVLIIFGPKRLPGLGKQLGSGLRDFKDAISGDSKNDDDEGDGIAGLPPAEQSKPTVSASEQHEPADAPPPPPRAG